MDLLSQYWIPAVFALSLSILMTTLAIKTFPLLKLMDRPHRYGLRRKPIPYYGGLSVFFSFLISVMIFVPIDRPLLGVLIAATLITLVGFLDDLISLSPFLRLFMQFLAGVILVWFGVGILSINLPFFGVLDLSAPIVGAIFTILWVMVIVNTMNFVDGVSGLSSGVSFIGGLTIFALSIHPLLHADPASQMELATIALIFGMTALGFFIFDFPKPAILLGDTGSTFFGFMLATLAIFSGGKVATAFLVLGIPILDMIWVILRRIWNGQKFWKGDLKHLHHRLLDLGLSSRQVVLMYLSLTLIFGGGAVALVDSRQKLFMLLALAVLMVSLALLLVFVPRKK